MAKRTRAAVSWTASLAMRCPRCFSTVFSLRVRWVGDLGVGVALGDELKDLSLPGGQAVEGMRGGGLLARDEGGEEGAGHFGAEVGVPAGDRADRQEEFLGDRPLEEIPLGAIPEGLPDQTLVGIHGEDQGPGLRCPAAQPGHGLEPVQVGHGDVDDENIGPQTLHQGQGLRTVGRLAEDRDVPRPLQEGADALADQVMIVGDDDADHAPSKVGIRATRRVP